MWRFLSACLLPGCHSRHSLTSDGCYQPLIVPNEASVEPSSTSDLQKDQANKERGNRAEKKKMGINADAVVCWYSESSLKNLLLQIKNVTKNQDMVKISSGSSSLPFATSLTLYWQAPSQVICQPVPSTGNTTPTWKLQGNVKSHIVHSDPDCTLTGEWSGSSERPGTAPQSWAESSPHMNE